MYVYIYIYIYVYTYVCSSTNISRVEALVEVPCPKWAGHAISNRRATMMYDNHIFQLTSMSMSMYYYCYYYYYYYYYYSFYYYYTGS